MAMGTISNAFTSISGALQADQAALSIVANNVANANTVGYTLETANFQENDPVTIGSNSYGQGAQETGATSVRDRVLTERLDQQQQLASASSTRLTGLNTVQALFTPDSGSASSTAGDIGSDLTSFFSSFSSLEANPTSNSLRQNVLSTATTLAGDISNAAASLNAQRASLDQEASGITSQVNALTSSIAQLNLQIESTSPNADAGVLEDQREQDVSQLSNLVGINQITTENNGLSITTTSGADLVSEGNSYQMTSGLVNGMTHFFIGTSDITSGLASGGGQLGGYLTVRDQDIPNVLSSLDQLAYSVSTNVNSLNNSGNDLAGVGGTVAAPLNIFNEPTSVTGSAANMSVVMTNPNDISAAAAGAGTGDNSNAILMANLASQTIVPSGGSSQTPTNFYSSFVSSLGATITEVQTENTAQNASVTQLKTQNDALSGVNLDDEASEMTTMERSYQAATQVFTMLDTLIQSTINLGQATAAG
jgi:flagellar hook-associated protein 1 FlgK